MFQESTAILAGLCLAFLVSYLSAGLLARLRFAVDVPNWRSLHVRPTPRSGGAAIAMGVGGAVIFWISADVRMAEIHFVTVSLVVGSLIMLSVGLWDDCRSIHPVVKFGAQIVVAGLVVASGASVREIGLPWGGVWHLGIFGAVLAVLWLLICMNAVNFIDGADGLVAKSLILGFAGVACLAVLVGLQDVTWLALALAASLCGFYWWNRPPARIFMGDSGSQFLGLMVGGLTLISAPPVEQRLSLLAIPLVFLPILFDASFTVARRAIALKPVWRPHRTHLFQLALRGGMSALTVSRLYFALTAFSLACGVAMLITPGPWHQLWVLPPMLAQGVWVWYVDKLRRARGLSWHDA